MLKMVIPYTLQVASSTPTAHIGLFPSYVCMVNTIFSSQDNHRMKNQNFVDPEMKPCMVVQNQQSSSQKNIL